MSPPTNHVVSTAGHVDHGKSTLVQALTGTDPDRWAEEKERGLTIDLGFAAAELPSGRTVSFVDVPGHERFIRNMLAGVGTVDGCELLGELCPGGDDAWCVDVTVRCRDDRDDVRARGVELLVEEFDRPGRLRVGIVEPAVGELGEHAGTEDDRDDEAEQGRSEDRASTLDDQPAECGEHGGPFAAAAVCVDGRYVYGCQSIISVNRCQPIRS